MVFVGMLEFFNTYEQILNVNLQYFFFVFASMSNVQNCGGTDANAFESGGAAGYNAPISCDVFFSYAWWITFYNLAVIVVTIAALIGFIQRFRPGVIILLAISLMQNLDTANNYLFYNYVETGSGTFDASARVATAGAIIKPWTDLPSHIHSA